MMELLSFIFRGGWTFFGCVFILAVVLQGIAAIVSSIGPSKDNHYHIDGSEIDVKSFLKWKEEKDNE